MSEDLRKALVERAHQFDWFKTSRTELWDWVVEARAALTSSQDGPEYLVWSNEHRAWWAPDRCGYTRLIDRAGRYSRGEAVSIARGARGGWEMAGLAGKNPPEIAIPLADALEQNSAAPPPVKEMGK